ncbi:hypothetical protein HPP92_005001 [Vanilla planifolia]|uniref:Uncharacterized protein n=1 Tax=Vanilla planifolia TaxID=51239 RepID=A0A835VBR3_VANPL|nr:hypothetical protein HPP92_005001 [Vanilla planifolia]
MEAVGGGGDEAMEAAVGAVAGLAVVDRRADVVYVDAVVGEVCGELEESVEVSLGGRGTVTTAIPFPLAFVKSSRIEAIK